MNRRFQDSQFYTDLRDLAMLVLATDVLAVVIFAAIWKLMAMLWHR
jgi:hypothetical protein